MLVTYGTFMGELYLGLLLWALLGTAGLLVIGPRVLKRPAPRRKALADPQAAALAYNCAMDAAAQR